MTNAAIATDAVNATSIADGSVTNTLLADGTIQEAKLSNAVQTKLNNPGVADWNTLTNKPSTIGAGATQAAARAAIGAGTSDLAIGTTATTAKAGDYAPTKADVGLGNIDNTSDATKNSATAILTNKTIDGSNNTITNIASASLSSSARTSLGKADTSVQQTASTFRIYGTDSSGSQTTFSYSSAATANSIVQRDAFVNLKADAFIPSVTSTVTDGTTTTLTVDSTEIQIFTGTTTQTITLPTTNIVAGQRYTIQNLSTGTLTVQSSAGNTIGGAIGSGHSMTVTALASTPTTASQWIDEYNVPAPFRSAAVISTGALRNADGNLFAVGFVPNLTSTATNGGTTTLNAWSSEEQIFTGTAVQNVVLPTTGVVTGQRFTIINQSTGTLTVNASSGAAIGNLISNQSFQVVALQAVPTTNAHWGVISGSSFVARATAASNSLAQRDGNANLSADAFIPTATSTVTANGTTTLTIDSTQTQVFTGTAAHTVLLPTTGVIAGQTYTVINQSTGGSVNVQSSNADLIQQLSTNRIGKFVARIDTPVVRADWQLVSTGINTSAVANTVPLRDTYANLSADAFVPGFTSIVTAAGTTTLTIDSTELQEFTGTSTQIVVLPTTNIVAGQRYTLINNASNTVTVKASGGATVANVGGGSQTAIFTALVATPTLLAHWAYSTSSNLGYATTAVANTLPRRDGNANLSADAFIPSFTTTSTAASMTTLTVDDTEIQQFTGSLAQTVQLPTTNVVAGQRYSIVNTSTGVLTIQASAGGGVITHDSGKTVTYTALQAAPTLPAHWSVAYSSNQPFRTGSNVGSVAVRDGNANLAADAFVPGLTSIVTAAATTTMTVDSTEVQVFTGSTTQTVVLPTTTITAGQRYSLINNSTGTITINSSAGNLVASLQASTSVVVTALQAVPTAALHWSLFVANAVTTNQAAIASTIAQRDTQANLVADAFIPGFTTTATSNGTTTLTVDSTQVQEFTGTLTHTIVLPTTAVVAGQSFTLINNSSGALIVNASNGSLISNALNPNGRYGIFTALISTPTTPAHWTFAQSSGAGIAQGAAASTIAMRDSNSILTTGRFQVATPSTITTVAGTTVFSISTTAITIFTGTTTQTVTLPTTSIPAGAEWKIINTSTDAVTINSSGGNLVKTLVTGAGTVVTALVATPTTAAHWFAT